MQHLNCRQIRQTLMRVVFLFCKVRGTMIVRPLFLRIPITTTFISHRASTNCQKLITRHSEGTGRSNNKLRVKEGGVDKQHLNADVIDDTTIENDDTDGLRVKEGGVDKEHLNADVIDDTTIENDDTDGLRVKEGELIREHLNADIVDDETIENDAANGLQVKEGGLDDSHVKPNMSDDAKQEFRNRIDAEEEGAGGGGGGGGIVSEAVGTSGVLSITPAQTFISTGITLPSASEADWVLLMMEFTGFAYAEWIWIRLQNILDLTASEVNDTPRTSADTNDFMVIPHPLVTDNSDILLGRTSANVLLLGTYQASVTFSGITVTVRRVSENTNGGGGGGDGDGTAADTTVDGDELGGLIPSAVDDVQEALEALDAVDAEDIPTNTEDFGEHIPSTADNIRKALKALNDAEYLFHRTVTRGFATGSNRQAGQIALVQYGGSTSTVYDLDISVFSGTQALPESFLNNLGRLTQIKVFAGSKVWRGELQSVHDDDETSATLRIDFATERTGTFTNGETVSISFGVAILSRLLAAYVELDVSEFDGLLADFSDDDLQDLLDFIDGINARQHIHRSRRVRGAASRPGRIVP